MEINNPAAPPDVAKEIGSASPADLAEFERIGVAALPEPVRAVWKHGLEIGNHTAWRQWALCPRVLVDVSACDTSTTVLGQPIDLPVLVAPHGLQGLCHPDAELATASACARAGTMMALPCDSSRSPEAVGKIGPFWMMLPFYDDRGLMGEIVQRAAAAGASAICVTVDYFPHFAAGWPSTALKALEKCLDDAGLLSFANNAQGPGAKLDASVTWSDFEWLRDLSELPLVLKGLMSADDARLAVEHGAAAIVVSNHGGHTVMDCLPTADVLAEVVDAVDGHLEVLVDGGIRSGADVLRALALGARAVMIGRSSLAGLALGGADGVGHVLTLIRGGLEAAMAVTGASTSVDINRTMINNRRCP